MYKIFKSILLSLSILIFFINHNVLAFHKEGKSETKIEIIEGIKKRDVQIKYCTSNVKKLIITEEIIDNNENKTTEEQLEEFNSDKPKTLVKKEYYEIKSYHSTKPKKFKGILFVNILKDLKVIDASTSFSKILNYYCVQSLQDDKSKKTYKLGEKIKKLHNELATDNGLKKASDPIGDEIFKTGAIKLDRDNLIYAKAQFIVDEEKKRKKAKEAKEKKEKNEQETKDFIAKIKPGLVDEINIKKAKFDKKLKDIDKKYRDLSIKIENFEKFFETKIKETDKIFKFLNKNDQQIIDKARELDNAQGQFLNEIILDDVKKKFKKINLKEAKEYRNYRLLEILLRDIDKRSNKKKCFEEGQKARGCKPSFPDQWNRIKSDDLGSEALEKNIDSLNKDLDDSKQKIEDNIDTIILELTDLEKNLKDKTPWNLIIIGVVVLIIIIGVGAYVYLNNRRIQKLQEEADKKVGSLKSDFEGKLKDTSERIKSVGRAAARSGQTRTSQQDQVVEEKPQTQEEIIAAKYDELVSDYREALDDFAKVAKFKQKWNGLALSRKERQDGTKTILISSPRAFEKADIWCVTFSDKYFAFAGSTVRSNMATYMNLDFEKASREFKGVFSISTGTNYTCEPSVLRKGGAGFVVERAGKIVFPS